MTTDAEEPIAPESAAPEPPAPESEPAPAAPATPPEPEVVVAPREILDLPVVTVTVTDSDERTISARLADGRRGVIATDQRGTKPYPTSGAEIEVAVLTREASDGHVELSRRWAQLDAGWKAAAAAHSEHAPLSGRVSSVTKGGLVVDVGIRGFMPSSMIDEHPVVDPSVFVGQDVEATVVEIDRAKDRLVLSRRDHLRRARRVAERACLSSLSDGDVVRGAVVEVVDFGLKVDLGGAVGLVHRTEFSWSGSPQPSKVASVGDELEVKVLKVQRSKRRVQLSIRELAPDPFSAVEPGTVQNATITRVVEYGAFAKLEDTDLIGLIHISELSEMHGARPDQIVMRGETVLVKVLSVDLKKRRIGLSINQAVLL